MAMKSSQYPGISIVFYDLEATGLHVKNDVITQIGAKCGSFKYNKYVVPTVPIPRFITTMTGISIRNNQMYCHGNPVKSVSPAEAATSFLDFLESIDRRVVLMAHNCFNTHGPMLAGLMDNHGLTDRFERVVEGFSDSLVLLKRYLERHRGKWSGYKLLDLAREFLGSSNGAHNAGKEAIMLERIIRHKSVSIAAKKIIDNTQPVSRMIQEYRHPPKPEKLERRYRENYWDRNYYEDRLLFRSVGMGYLPGDEYDDSSDDDMSVDNFVDEGSGDSDEEDDDDEGDDEDDAALASIVPGLNRFSQKLFEYLCLEEKNNLVISPVGISILLAMIADGAKGPSLAELESILRLPKTEEGSNAGYKVLLNCLESLKESEEEVQCEMHVMNKIVTSDTLKIEEKFKNDMNKYFSSELLAMDWSKVDEICQAANGFCKEKTNGQISSILTPSDVPENPSLILLNAIYFKSEWEEKFPQCYTGPKTFYVTSDIEVEVPMMRVETSFAHGEIPEVHASFVVLPFKDILMKMIVFLPKELHGIKDLELYLSTVNFSKLLETSERRNVCLSLPKFRAEISMDVIPTLKKMGLKEVCDVEKADFTGVSTTLPLCIGKVIQKTFLDVNEVGVEATGVTTVRLVEGGPSGARRPKPLDFNVNHPFVCAIIAEDHGVPIFMAKIKNPTP